MEKSNAIGKMNNNNQQVVKENPVRDIVNKFGKWWNTTAFPALKAETRSFFKAISRIRLNWTGILILVILTYMAQNGVLEGMPGIKWIVESAVRLMEWCMGILKSFIGWFVTFLESKPVDTVDIFNIFEVMANFLRDIFGIL